MSFAINIHNRIRSSEKLFATLFSSRKHIISKHVPNINWNTLLYYFASESPLNGVLNLEWKGRQMICFKFYTEPDK